MLVVLAGLVLLWAALYNGYPLTFWDTRVYVEHAGSLLPRTDRLIGYSLVIRLLSAQRTLWPVVVAQCLLVAWLVWLCWSWLGSTATQPRPRARARGLVPRLDRAARDGHRAALDRGPADG
jgi:hypothetical protein